MHSGKVILITGGTGQVGHRGRSRTAAARLEGPRSHT
jgi:FlaA1/EpsC-like NDP-sugar epimerase